MPDATGNPHPLTSHPARTKAATRGRSAPALRPGNPPGARSNAKGTPLVPIVTIHAPKGGQEATTITATLTLLHASRVLGIDTTEVEP